jgi:hypothetical protein
MRRRRRDLALLKALGFTRRQISATIAWQATSTVAVGLLIGVPVGIADLVDSLARSESPELDLRGEDRRLLFVEEGEQRDMG